MNKVHACQIKKVEQVDWMFSDESTYYAHGFKGEQQHIPYDFYKLFNPEAGQWCIVWPHGLTTFRPDESFQRDFRHLGGTQYETEVTALFLEARSTPEWKARKAIEREEQRIRNEERRVKAQQELEEAIRNPVKIVNGVMIRRVFPGLMPMPEGIQVQPMSKHIGALPILGEFKAP